MVKDFPLDYESIPEGGLDAWRKDFALPCSPDGIFDMAIAIREAFYDYVRAKQGSYAGDLLLAEIKLYLDFSPALCGLRLVEMLKDKGCAPKYSPRSGLAAFERGELPGGKVEKPSGSPALKRRLRNIAYNVRVNRDPFYLLNSRDEHGVLLNIQPSEESNAYARKLGVSYRYADKIEWLDGWDKVKISEAEAKEAMDAAAEAAEAMAAAAAKHGFETPPKVANAIFSMIHARLSAAARNYGTLKRNVAAFGKPIHLLASNLAPSFARLFALCVNKAGGFSVAFVHGYDPMRSSRLRYETSLASRVATYTEGAAEETRLTLQSKSFPLPSFNAPEMFSLDTPMFRRIWESSRAKPPSSMRAVVMPGFPYDSLYNMMWGPPELAMLDLELRVAECLRDAGFDVIYKTHPEGLTKGDELIPGVRIRRDRFEDMMLEAGAFVFPYHPTSVFPLALASDRRMAMIHSCSRMEDYEPDALRMLDRRCKVIAPTLDERNRWAFDAEALVSHLSAPPSPPDMELLSKYFDIK